MGQTLSEPVTEKHTSFGDDETLIYAVSEMQGWRISMEDAHATILSLDEKVGDEKASFFAVYDGHGGSTVAKYSGETLHERLAATEEYKRGDYEAALKRAFLKTDEDLKANPEFANDPSGCTAVAALLVAGPKNGNAEGKTARRIVVANAGDSRCVLGLKGAAKAMSYDHKPGNETEHYRIMQAGGFVEFGRVNGNLALSRAIGDFEFKQNFGLEAEKQIVTADPEIISHDVTGEEEFLVLACDGIWDCLSNQEVVDFVRRSIANGKELQAICEEMMDKCLAPDSEIGGVGCDNMTVCVVALLGERTKDEWYKWVKERVDNKYGWDTPEEIAPVFQSQGGRQGGQPGFGGIGGGGVLSALAGGLGAGDDGEGGRAIRLPGGLAGALGGAGIVFRPGPGTDEDGDIVYEAHVVDEDDSSDESEQSAAIKEIDDAAEQKDAKASGNATAPEIVDSPGEVSKSSEAGSKSTDSDDMEVDAATKTGTSD